MIRFKECDTKQSLQMHVSIRIYYVDAHPVLRRYRHDIDVVGINPYVALGGKNPQLGFCIIKKFR